MTHNIAGLLFGTMLLGLALLTALAWRLAQGPMDISFLIPRIEAAINAYADNTRIRVGMVALTWEGFSHGLDRPLDLRLHDIKVIDAADHVWLDIPTATTSLSFSTLLTGRVLPRSIELTGVRLALNRNADGSIALATSQRPTDADTRPLPSPGGDWFAEGHPLQQLQRLRLTNLAIQVTDQNLGIVWSVSHADADLIRRGPDAMELNASMAVRTGDQSTTLSLHAETKLGQDGVRAWISTTKLVPAELARIIPAWDELKALALPISARVELDLSHALEVRAGTLTMTAGAGSVSLGQGIVPIRAATVVAKATPTDITIHAAQFILPGGAEDSTITLTGTGHRTPERLTATLLVGLDRVALADLPHLWPLGIGGGARPWITENMTEGLARDLRLELDFSVKPDLSDVTLTRATGTMEAENAIVHWWRPAPPVEQGRARITLTDADTIDIQLISGRQRVGGKLPLTVTGGSMRITGLMVKDQTAGLTIQTTGPLAEVITLLREPRLQLLSTHPIELKEPAGDAAVAVRIKLPLETKLDIDDVDISVTAQLKQAHLTGIAAGRDLDRAELDITATKHQLTLKGTGLLGGISAKFDGLMDFQANKPRDVTQRITVTGRADTSQLAAAGLDLTEVLTGEIPFSLIWRKQVNNEADMSVEADLTAATATFAPLAWQKPAGVAAKATARVIVTKDRFGGIDAIAVDGNALSLRAVAEAKGGRITAIRLNRAALGQTDVTGLIRLPPGAPMEIELTGPVLDVSAKATEKTPPRDKTKPEPKAGPAWKLTGQFDRVRLAHDVVARNVRVDAAHDGRLFPRLLVTGITEPDAAFDVRIDTKNGARSLTATAGNAGALLTGLDGIRSILGGSLSLTCVFDDSTPAHAVTGTLEITDFRARDAPVLGRLLQALTLYGLIDIARGPGLGFAKLTAPFVLSDEDLELKDARAFSQSLGVTVKGHININTETALLEGTIVPAYFFNALLGKIPLMGPLFRAEEGGGLFAARYTLNGALSDPEVFVNPLSILTPGFLRGIFGAF